MEVRTAVGITAAQSPDPGGQEAIEVATTYTANNLVETVTDAENNKTSYEYDGHDRLAKTYFPMPSPKGAGTSNGADYEQLTYESLAGGARTSSLVAAFRNRAGDMIGFSYDTLGRLTSKNLPNSEPDVTYGYDLLGRLTSASQTGHLLSFTYDALGRVLTQTGPLGTVASEYDLAGRRTKLSWPDTFFVAYDYLITGETTRIRENGATSGIGLLASFGYDQLGRRESLTLGNGVATTYAYDPVSRLDELKLDLAGTADDLTSEFTYNPASQIAGSIRSNAAYAWTGHGSGTLSTTANGRNQIAGWVNTLGYDTKGNITSNGNYTYTYSSENLLTSLTNPTPGAVQSSSTYAYDPLKRLAVIDSNNPALDVQFGYDGQEMVYEGLSANRTRRYVYGPGTDEPLVGYLVTSTGTSRLWYQADERGSVTRLSNDAGTPGGIGKFDEYGVGGTSRFRYTGQYWLGDSNLLYYRARIYDAQMGRFLQPDPIGYGDGMNLYAYVKGDPINQVDPSGKAGMCNNPWGGRAPVPCPNAQKSPISTGGGSGTGGNQGGGKGSGNHEGLHNDTSLASLADCARGNCGLVQPASSIANSDTIPWTTKDFFGHYFEGTGSEIQLRDIGLASFFENDPTVRQVTGAYISSVISVRVFEFHLPLRQIGVSDLTFRLTALGRSAVYGESMCLSTSCFFRFSINDAFEDPMGLGLEIPGGVPYRIRHDWGVLARRRGGW